MASRIHKGALVEKPFHRYGARVLLVNKNPEELSYYGAILQELRCRVRTSSSFAKGAQCLEGVRYDLIILDQGSSRFEGRQLLMTAMEADPEVPVLVLARSYDRGCCEEAMQSGALDYVEGPLSEPEIVAFLETYVLRRTGFSRLSANHSNGPTPGEKKGRKALFQRLQPARCAPATARENIAW